MIYKKIDEIILSDIEVLKENEVCESRTLEYKEMLTIDNRDERKEFLADISSFANADGGDIIFGVAEDQGKISDIVGIDFNDIDSLKQKIENIIREGIDPRIGIQFKDIDTGEKKGIIVIRIDKSYNKPHRVIFGKDNRFFSRNSAGKYPMDVQELKIMFNSSLVTDSLIKNFQRERIQAIKQNDLPVKFEGLSKFVIHIIPYEALIKEENYNIFNTEVMGKLFSIGTSYSQATINFEGVYTYSNGSSKSSYTQLYRTGIIEAVKSSVFAYTNENGFLLYQKTVEDFAIKYIHEYLSILKSLEVVLPLYIFISLIGVKGYKIPLPQNYFDSYTNLANSDDLILPGIYISSYEVQLDQVLRKAFDLIWNAFGREKSIYYTKEGQRIER